MKFRTKSLQKFYENDDTRDLNPSHVQRIRNLLTALSVANTVQDMNIPGYHLHSLGGSLEGYWSVRVNRNWRIIFRFIDGKAENIELIDYH